MDLDAAYTESRLDVTLPDCLNISLIDHVLCPFAGIQFKISKCFRTSRVVLELVSLELSFNQDLDKLSELVVLDQVVGQFLGIRLDSAEPLASHRFWVERIVGSKISRCMMRSSFGSGFFSIHVCKVVVSSTTVKFDLYLTVRGWLFDWSCLVRNVCVTMIMRAWG